jgi:plastocyanin
MIPGQGRALAAGLAIAIAVASSGCASSSSSNGASGGPDAATPTFNGCPPEMFVRGSSASTVNFGGTAGSPLFGYAPPCLRVAPGAVVTFAGDFSVHPLSPGTSPTTTAAGSANNPIARTESGSSLAVTFPAVGVYPYFCQMHYAAGMAGVVLVE